MGRLFTADGPSMAASVEPVFSNLGGNPPGRVCEVGLTFFEQAEQLPPPWGARLARAMIPASE